jgi:hypothetical protein
MTTLSELTIMSLEVSGFQKVVEFGETSLKKSIRYSKLPQDDIEDLMSADDIILSSSIVDVYVNLDCSVSIEFEDVAVGPIPASDALSDKIIKACL